jgi:hypothetical protein
MDKNFNDLDKEEISLLIDQKELELRQCLESGSVVASQMIDIRKRMIELESQKLTMSIALRQSSHSKQRIESELRELKNRYFRQGAM